MSDKLKRFKQWTRGALIGFGIVFLILVQVVNYREMTAWQDPMTAILWVYIFTVFAHFLLLDIGPMLWNWIKKDK